MNNNRLIGGICIVSIVISSIALIIGLIAFWSSCSFEYNSENALMSAFSIIVTLLIGSITVLIAWQVYNHYVAKDEVKRMITEEAKALASDIWRVLDSNETATNDLCLLATNDIKDYTKINVYMEALDKALKCKSESLRDYSINFTMERFHRFYHKTINSDKHILKGKRTEYHYLCNQIKHKYVDELKTYIDKAEEVNE